MTTLYALGRELAILNDFESYVNAIVKSIGETFGHNVTIFLPDAQRGGDLVPYASYSNTEVDEHERAAAIWSYEHDKQVGFGTDTLPEAKARYIPLTTARGKVGVLALWTGETKTILTVEQEKLLSSFADLAAVAIEGILLTEQAHKEQILGATREAPNCTTQLNFSRFTHAACFCTQCLELAKEREMLRWMIKHDTTSSMEV